MVAQERSPGVGVEEWMVLRGAEACDARVPCKLQAGAWILESGLDLQLSL